MHYTDIQIFLAIVSSPSSLLAEFIRELRSVADTFPEITVLSSRMFSD
ncbi:MAG: hypothetical protein PUH04_07935 [Firmicutes bacterium]|nr:hypothetical protein [Blautia sp.]MDD7371542.1 hypothetical protein [Bacillota bacterium]